MVTHSGLVIYINMEYAICYYLCATSINDNINNYAMQLLCNTNFVIILIMDIDLTEYVVYLQTYLLFCI